MACFCGGRGFTVSKEELDYKGWGVLVDELVGPGYTVALAHHNERIGIVYFVVTQANVSPRSDKA